QGRVRVTAMKARTIGGERQAMNSLRRMGPLLLVGTILGGMPIAAAYAQDAAPAASAPAAAALPGSGVVRTIAVAGSQRLEPDTVRSYIKLKPGDPYTRETLDQALKDL